MLKYSNRLKPWIVERMTPRDTDRIYHAYGRMYSSREHKKINYKYLSQNENAMELLMNNQDKIDWDGLSANLSATELLYANQDKISIHRLVDNPHPLAIKLLSENVDCITDWNALLRNPAAVSIWRQHADIAMLDGYCIPEQYLTSELPPPWYNMGYSDPRDKFIDLLISKFDPNSDRNLGELWGKGNDKPRYQRDWNSRRVNRTTRRLLRELMLNRNPKLIKILEPEYPEDFYWETLSTNPIAIELLEKRQDDYLDWDTIWANPAIFEEEYDYEGMRQAPRADKAELLDAVMHPDRIDRFIAAGGTLREFIAHHGLE